MTASCETLTQDMIGAAWVTTRGRCPAPSLRRAKPAELPVDQPALLPSILIRAEEVIR